MWAVACLGALSLATSCSGGSDAPSAPDSPAAVESVGAPDRATHPLDALTSAELTTFREVLQREDRQQQRVD